MTFYTNFIWEDLHSLLITRSPRSVSLHQAGDHSDNRAGFALVFKPKDIAKIEELLCELRELKNSTERAEVPEEVLSP